VVALEVARTQNSEAGHPPSTWNYYKIGTLIVDCQFTESQNHRITE